MIDLPDNGAEEGVDPKIRSAEHLHQRNFLVRISPRRLRLQLFVQLLPSCLHLRGGKVVKKNVDERTRRRSGGDLELSFVAGGDTCQLSKCFVHSAFHQQPARRLRYQPLERGLRKLLKCRRRIYLLPAEEDRKDCQGCGES